MLPSITFISQATIFGEDFVILWLEAQEAYQSAMSFLNSNARQETIMRLVLGSSDEIVRNCVVDACSMPYCTFLLPPVIVTLTNRRVYTILFFARPFGSFFFS